MSQAEADEHQRKHGFGPVVRPKEPEAVKVPKPRQNKTEAEYGLILEAMKRKGEILDYRPFGIKLEWGADPVTGKPMVYSPDFVVWTRLNALEPCNPPDVLIETKGPYIYPKDMIRFRGCRAEWGTRFEMQLHQKTAEGWRKLL